MLLQTKNIKAFAARTRNIKGNSIIPILDYILLEVKDNACCLIKTNLGVYCKYSFPLEHEDCKMLIDERMLFSLAQLSDEITITKTDSKTILKGKLTQSFVAGGVVEDYPKFPEYNTGGGSVLNTDALKSIGIAAKYTDGKNIRPAMNCVMSTNNDICGTDSQVIYRKKFTDTIPKLFLSNECFDIISKYEKLVYFSTDNWQIFEAEDTVYGFSKTEAVAPDYEQLLQTNKDNSIVVLRLDLVMFCESTISIMDIISVCKMETGNGCLTMSSNNPDKSISNEIVLPIADTSEPITFTFLASIMLKAVKSLPYETLNLVVNKTRMFIFSDEDKDFTVLMMGALI